MRFLADENFPRGAVVHLRAVGHDVVWVHETASGASDPDIFVWAIRDARLLLTFDKDFGALAARSELTEASGVILFRMPPGSPQTVGERIAAIIDGRDDWAGHFSVVSRGRVRVRRLARNPRTS
jgi:predicted nuclease of predicted toxin-antitoxin system